jgi:hypothetical protein
MRTSDRSKQRSKQLAALLERRRRELADRMDISPKLRRLSRAAAPTSLLPERMRRSRALSGALAVALVALVGACVLGATAVGASGLWLQGQLGDPATTAQNFYGALHQQDYARAYSYLTSGAQQRMSRADFVTQYSDLDAVAGVVESYTIGTDTVAGTSATTVVSVVRRGDVTRAQSQTLTLVKQGDAWRIDGIAAGGSGPAAG